MKKISPKVVFVLFIVALIYSLFDNLNWSVAFVSLLLAILSGYIAWGK